MILIHNNFQCNLNRYENQDSSWLTINNTLFASPPNISLIQPPGLLWIRNGVASRTRAGILPLCSTLVGQNRKCYVQFLVPQFRKDMEGLQHVKGSATRMVQGLEHKSCEEWLRELGMLILEERKLRRDLITLYICLERRLQLGVELLSQETVTQDKRTQP